MFNEHGHEYFVIIPRTEGAEWRKAKADAIDLLSEAVSLGLEPGEVVRDDEETC